MAEIDEFERQVFAAVHELLQDIARMRQHCHCM
jgi:hypothetical protein